jgi:hypothetical protein
MDARKRHLLQNLFYALASVIAAFLLVQIGTVDSFLESVGGLTHVGSFLAGMFFTSIFTTAPAIVVLGQLALTTPLWIVALFGGLGAVVGDYLLFLVIRQGLSKDVEYLVSHVGFKRLRKVLHTKLFHHVLPFIGALVLASPLPDEIGLAMLGFSKVDKDRFLLISLAMNSFGIFIIGIVARSVAGVPIL